MKIISAVAKILAALTAVVGAIYILATYGEQIVAWCKKVIASLPECPCGKCECECDGDCECDCECECEAVPVEEVAVEEVPVEEVPVEEPVAEADVVADEADFAE